jgi:hypothetical protein
MVGAFQDIFITMHAVDAIFRDDFAQCLDVLLIFLVLFYREHHRKTQVTFIASRGDRARIGVRGFTGKILMHFLERDGTAVGDGPN